MSDLDLTIPDIVFTAAAALRTDTFYILRPQSSSASGVTTPSTPAQLGPFLGEFWMKRGDELAADIAKSPGEGRLATALSLVIQTTDQIGVGGLLYDVAWAPAPSGLDLTRIVYLRETGLVFTPESGDVLIPSGTWIGIGRIPTYAEDVTA